MTLDNHFRWVVNSLNNLLIFYKQVKCIIKHSVPAIRSCRDIIIASVMSTHP